MEKTITIKEVLEDVYKTLGDINVPASKINEIGIPVARSMDGIRLCLEAFEMEEKNEQKKKGNSEDPVFEAVDEIPSDEEPVQLM